MLAFKTLVAVALLVAAATAVEVVEIPAEELRSERGTFGLPNLDPYHIKDLALKVKTLPISFHVSFTNLSVYGMPDGIIRDARSDLTDDGVNMDIGVTFPKLTFKGIFEFTNGVFASWNFKGRGPFDVTFHDVVVLMVNRLWSEVVDLGKPIINENIAEHLTALANDVFRSVPYDQLFPKNSEPMDGP
ncbi:hypothetical protein FOCC_FOCC001930 [Frankliniella occidentalis]|nr:hypothetical protein FOCC_FOCC001930 [Frankliniella occidentalis]